jgi:DNA repair protein RecO (recombination protein O)
VPSRQRVYHSEAVVLRRQDLGEADRLLTIFTPDRGKLRVVAKGVRKPRSRKAGHLEPLTRARLMVSRGRELDIITQAEAIDQYPSLREDLIKLGQASYTVELLDRFTVEEGASSRLYELLVDTLDRLDEGDEAAVALRYFELRMLDLVGYRPELFRCVGCKNEIRPRDQFFSLALGGVLCPTCGPGKRDAFPISLAALKVLRYYQRNAYSVVVAAKIRATVHAELNTLMENYLTYLLERRLNSPAFLRRVRELGQNARKPETTS